MRIEPSPSLGGDVEWLASFLAESGKQLLTPPIAIDIRGVEEIHTKIQGTL
jgi:hypothetical protein